MSAHIREAFAAKTIDTKPICQCMADRAVSAQPRTEDEALVLAYHAFSRFAEATERDGRSKREATRDLTALMESYADDRNIPADLLWRKGKPALDLFGVCSTSGLAKFVQSSRPTKGAAGLRGVMPLSSTLQP